ncbi:MAG: DUF58 domain-containing protein [Alphaproteobacteria bacterium]|nr:DUF58 domain-containing protein [Alphaproteobacteria bacterium]
MEHQSDKVEASFNLLLKQRKRVERFEELSKRKRHLSEVGETSSLQKGEGMEFNEVRAYQEGDDIRSIDWRLTAKYQKPYTKLFHQEKGRPFFLVCDFQKSMKFGTRGQFKSVLAAKLASFISFYAFENKEKVGAILLDENREVSFQRASSRAHLMQIIKALSQITKLEEKEAEQLSLDRMNAALKKVALTLKTGEKVFIISDFYHVDETFEKRLFSLSKKAEVVLVFIYDRLEEKMPKGIFTFSDKKVNLSVNTLSKSFQKTYAISFKNRKERVKKIAARAKAKMIFLSTETEDFSLTFLRGQKNER